MMYGSYKSPHKYKPSPPSLFCALKENEKSFMRDDGKAMLLKAVPAETTPEPTAGSTAEETAMETALETAEEIRKLAECELRSHAITVVAGVSMFLFLLAGESSPSPCRSKLFSCL